MYITPSTGSTAQQMKRLEMVQELREVEIVSEEIKQNLENNGIPREMVDSIPDHDLRDKLSARWFNRDKLWYAVPQKPLELRHATVEDMTDVMRIFRELVKDD